MAILSVRKVAARDVPVVLELPSKVEERFLLARGGYWRQGNDISR